MADSWTALVKDWANAVAIQETELDTELRDRFTALYNVVTADAYAGPGGDTRIWHGHRTGTLASRPAAAHAGRLYYATDLGVQFFDTGARWDVIGVNSRVAEHFPEEFMLSQEGGDFTTMVAQLGWASGVTGSGRLQHNLSPGISKLRLNTLGTINSLVELASQVNGTHYTMDQASDRVPALLYQRNATVDVANQLVLFGLTTVSTSDTPDGIYFKRTDTAAVGNWRCITRAAGVDITNTDSGVPGNTAYHDFEIVIKSLTSIDFFIDGLLEATHTPNAALQTTAMQFRYHITNTDTAAARLDLDRLDWYARR